MMRSCGMFLVGIKMCVADVKACTALFHNTFDFSLRELSDDVVSWL